MVRRAGHEALTAAARDIAVPLYDCLPFFEGKSPFSLMNRARVDPHPNAEGHALLAEGIAKILFEHGYLPEP